MKELWKGIKGVGVVAFAFLFILVQIYRGCIATTNEIGFLGADKTGRQIFIQSLDAWVGEGVEVTSDFFDRPLFLRLFADPMRTTIRFNYNVNVQAPSFGMGRSMLDSSWVKLIRNPKGTINLQEDWIVTADEFRQMIKKKGIRTVEDLLGGYGFKRLEVYQAGRKLYDIPIRQKRPNVKVAGGS